MNEINCTDHIPTVAALADLESGPTLEQAARDEFTQLRGGVASRNAGAAGYYCGCGA